MKCPKCGSPVRPSKKNPGYYLCDTCKVRYKESSIIKDEVPKKEISKVQTSSTKKSKKKKKRPILKFLLLLILLAGIGTGFYFSNAGTYVAGFFIKSEPQIPKTESLETFDIGAAATINDITVEIISVGNTASENNILPMEVKVTNNSDSPINISSISNFELLINEEAVSHSAIAYETLTDEQSRLNGAIEANQSLTGYLCYETAGDWTSAKLRFAYPVWSLEKLEWEIKK